MTRRTTFLLIAVAAVVIALVAVALTRPVGSDGAADPVSPVASQRPVQPTARASGAPSATPSATGQSDEKTMARRIPGDPMALGQVDAPVVLVEYADFRCPFCGVFARETKPKLMPLVADGTLRIEFRDFPVFGSESELAAVAGRSAAAQGRFWPFYDAVYAAAPEHGHAELTRATLLDFGEKAGLPDMYAYREDMAENARQDAVQRDFAEGTSIGVPSTPAFLINGKAILGAQPTSDFLSAIREAKQHS